MKTEELEEEVYSELASSSPNPGHFIQEVDSLTLITVSNLRLQHKNN